ncbi:MAG: hypothetical protein PVH45_00510 [Candidatus Omnitrophota bacterium]|jgi:phosphoglycolate phosphatase-like HAD superfamily hydrolase
MSISTVIFDLDGTLVDSAEDMLKAKPDYSIDDISELESIIQK